MLAVIFSLLLASSYGAGPFTGDIAGIDKINSLLQSSQSTGEVSLEQMVAEYGTSCSTVSALVDCPNSMAVEESAKNAARTAIIGSVGSMASSGASVVGGATGSKGLSTAGQVGQVGSMATGLVGPEIACDSLVCKISTTETVRCQTTCQASCKTSVAVECGKVAAASCLLTPPVAYAGCVAAAIAICTPPQIAACEPPCIATCEAPAIDFAVKKKVTCRQLCKAIANQTASKYKVAAGVVGGLAALGGAITGGSGDTSKNKDNKTNNDTNPPPPPSGTGGGDPCAGLKDKQLSACICKNNLKLDYDPATDSCVDTKLPTGLGADTKTPPAGSSYGASGAGTPDTKATGSTETGAGGSGGGAGGAAGNTLANAKASAAPSGTGVGNDKDKNKTGSSDQKLASNIPFGGRLPIMPGALPGADETGEAAPGGEGEKPTNEEITDIAKKDVNIWDSLSKTYQQKYASNEISEVIEKKIEPTAPVKKQFKKTKKEKRRTRKE